MQLPRLAMTMGDAAGIGPELVARCWLEPTLHDRCVPLAIGHPAVLRRAASLVGAGQVVVEVDEPDQAAAAPGTICCLPAGDDAVADVIAGTVDARAGLAAYQCLALAAELALAGRIDALVTAPLNKKALREAGFAYPGHTEALAELTGADEVAMMLYLAPDRRVKGSGGLGVVHVTLHVALSEVPRLITVDSVLEKARLADRVMTLLLAAEQRRPLIALAALNPHAGEGGLFGNQEQQVLEPAVAEARRAGLALSGPYPADSLFWRACQGEFDAVVAMYHDQGHVALKLIGFHRAVNITLGLPIVRTSPTYGTAFDIAWQGVANATGMLEAARVAATLARHAARTNRAETLACSPQSTVQGQP